MKKYLTWKLLIILIVTLGLGFFDLPGNVQGKILPFTPDSIQETKVRLGLDLQGGSQLDYKIDLRKVPKEDREDIINGVREVIERRVNNLGVAEPNIYRTEIADETHITVELAETAVITQEDVNTYLSKDKVVEELTDDEKKLVSLEKAKATVGKTIQLEFKEKKDALDPQEKDKVKAQANTVLEKINAGEDFTAVGREEANSFPSKVTHATSQFTFEEDIPSKIKNVILGLKPGEYTHELVETGGTFHQDLFSQEMVEDTGFGIIKLLETKEEIKHPKIVDANHILIAYEGLENATEETVRTRDEAYALAKDIKKQLDDGGDFAALAKEHSDDASNKDNGGKLSEPVVEGSIYVFDFEEAAMKLEKAGEMSDIIETQFGYHIIRANNVQIDVKETQYRYESIIFSTVPDPWKETGLTGKHFVHADVQIDQVFKPYIFIQFNDEGAKLFEEITTRNVGKPVAIFVGGDLISFPNVNEAIAGGRAQITGDFTQEQAQSIARNLNTGAIPAPIILTGEYTIGATLGSEALSDSLKAGAVGLLLVMIFMALYYRVPGLVADAALLVYAAILVFLIKSELSLGISLVIALGIFFYLIYRILNNKDSGWEKTLSLVLSCFVLFFLSSLLKTGVVLTLAGIAGIILSIGMAVDANILIFERFKEELQKGKSFQVSIETGFDRAWSAIRDSNFSTLITCGILYYFGSSIIRGFAFNLAAGILVSMFTAMVITRTLLSGFIGKRIAANLKAFGVKEGNKLRNFKFIGNSGLWLGFSGIMVGLSIVCITVFGLNLGIDFKGGTLMELQFNEPVTKEALAKALTNAETKYNGNPLQAAEESKPATETDLETVTTSSTTDSQSLEETAPETIDLTNLKIIESTKNAYILKTKYLTSATHDQIIKYLKEDLPQFTEPRFTTIGPVIGSTLLQKAITAIFIALLIIIIYIALAFRKIPREVSPWRFGATAIAALVHDMIIVTGIFALLGAVLNVEIDALFITAMLTVFGYSVNDTIVVFDRLRENLITRHGEELGQIAETALNEVFTRSINTSLSTLITLVAVLIWGSPSIFYFILALTIGTAVGTYSSIFTASPLLVIWNNWAKQRKDS